MNAQPAATSGFLFKHPFIAMNLKHLVPALIAATLLAAPVPAPADPQQPKMEKAIELLQQARTAANPIPLLKAAREHVKAARHNKGGRRPDAIETINEAIAAAEKGEKPEGKITKAIAQIRSGEDRAR